MAGDVGRGDRMRVVELTAFHARIPLKKRVRHASHERDANDTLLVRTRLDCGAEGWGEGLPRPYVTGETIDTAWQQLHATDWPRELGESFVDLPAAVRFSQAWRLAESDVAGRRDCFGHAVRCAVELSLLDAATRALGQPLSAVVACVPESYAVRGTSERVQYSAAVTPMSWWSETVRAWKIRYYRFRFVKVKVGVAGVDDAACLQRLRRIVGPEVDLRIDANESWTCATARERLAPLLPHGLTAVEQPVPHAEVDGLAALRRDFPLPIVLDESVCSLSDGQRAIERGWCDLFNIRLSKCGGFVRSLQLAALAHRAGLGFQLGCQVGETGILSAAGRHFATSIAGLRYLEGSFDRLLVRERLTVEDVTFGRAGFGRRLEGPGLGVQIDPRAAARVTRRQQTWRW